MRWTLAVGPAPRTARCERRSPWDPPPPVSTWAGCCGETVFIEPQTRQSTPISTTLAPTSYEPLSRCRNAACGGRDGRRRRAWRICFRLRWGYGGQARRPSRRSRHSPHVRRVSEDFLVRRRRVGVDPVRRRRRTSHPRTTCFSPPSRERAGGGAPSVAAWALRRLE